MKKVINFGTILMLSLVLFSCALTQLNDREKEIVTYGVDFRKYNEKGFLFMPDEYYGEYEVKGIITVESYPEVRYHEGTQSRIGEPGYQVKHFTLINRPVTQISTEVDIDELLEYIFNLSIEWGGDAFTHFELTIKTGSTDDYPNAAYEYPSISGLVIKRK